tara:strand:+ start:101 stop:292 length:192 start_codon:yes stop_codon:yes gene_type:complete
MSTTNPLCKINDNKMLIINVGNDVKTLVSDIKYLRVMVEDIKKQLKEDEPVIVEKPPSNLWFY